VGDEPIAKLTHAKLFNYARQGNAGVCVPFSTVGHSGPRPETLRDPRLCREIFTLEDGNWDTVGVSEGVLHSRHVLG
jgi:catalase